jgi:hypothetical protein
MLGEPVKGLQRAVKKKKKPLLNAATLAWLCLSFLFCVFAFAVNV